MRVTLREAVNKFCGKNKELELFKYYLKRSLTNTKSGRIMLGEIEPIEVVDGVVTIVFTWDNVYAINHLNNKYCDLTHTEDVFEVFD